MAGTGDRRRVTFGRRWTTVGRLRIHDRADERVAGRTVVMLHGLAVSHRYLMPTAQALADRYPVVVPDLPGYGRSDKPPHPYDVGDHAAALVAWLDARGLDKVALVGHSFGAEIAARLAVIRPDRVTALVLAAPTPDPRARTRGRLIARWAADLLVESPWQAPVLLADVVQAGLGRIWATIGHSVGNPVERDLRRLSVAPLVLGGELDTVAPLRWRTGVAAIAGGRSVTVPHEAHNVLTTSGRRSADAIAAYLRAAETGTSVGAHKGNAAGMTNIQQPEMRRSGESPTSKQRTEDASPTEAPHGGHDKDGSPVPESQVSPYGPSGKVASDGS